MRLRVWAMRLRGLFTKPHLDEEIDTHISLLAADFERRGMEPAEAHRQARRQIGGVTQVTETYRDQYRLPLFDTLANDFRYAWRQLRRSPIFASAAVLTLGLGIGANTAVFRGLDALLLRSLPVRHADELVQLRPLDLDKPGTFSYPVFRDIATSQQVVAPMFAAGDAWIQAAAVQGGGNIRLEHSRLVSGGYFRILGVDAVLGRTFSEEDDRPGAPGVAVLSFKIWQREFGLARDVVGKVLVLNSKPVTVIGVAPRSFLGERILLTPDAWIPMSMQPQLGGVNWLGERGFNFVDVMGRRRPGVSIQRAQAVLDPQYRRLLERESGRDRLLVVSGRHGITLPEIQSTLIDPLRALMWMVAAVLAIACCNLANLLLARGAARTHEIGVRLALGAGRSRLVRQLLSESLLLSGLGTLLGVALAEWATRLLVAYATDDEFSRGNFGTWLDWHVLGFVGVVSVAATCLFGVAPALAGTRLDIRSALQTNWRTQSQGRPRQLLGKAFVIVQVALCLMLLAGAALLGRSLWNLQRQDLGYRPEGLIIADLPLDMTRDFGPERNKFFTGLRQPLFGKINAIPGVRSAALSDGGPFGHMSYSTELSLPGRPSRPSDHTREIRVSPRYFETMRIDLLAGRGILESDREKTPKVVVLSQTAARTFFNGADPIGHYISFELTFDQHKAWQVVGVAHDVRIESPRENFAAAVFVPIEQQSSPFHSVVVRTDRDPTAMAGTVRAALAELNRDLAVGDIRPVSEILDDQLAGEQTMAALAAGLGVLALVMASVGLYGVISYAVAGRTQEMGIRLALGASGGQLTGLVMREVGLLLAAGIVVGAGASAACTQVVRSMLFGITPRDAGWLVLAGLLLILVASTAGYLPARRAASLDPLEALRQE